jgi:hypothetical protein
MRSARAELATLLAALGAASSAHAQPSPIHAGAGALISSRVRSAVHGGVRVSAAD